MTLSKWLDSHRTFFEQRLPEFMPSGCPNLLREAMEYSLYAGGKRLRPILTFAAAEACGGKRESALPAAVAVEMIHTYSLIHDDLPAMDDDDLRRGKPTSHKVFGEAMAILAGDALLTEAFSVVAQCHLPLAAKAAIITELARCSGPEGMVAGQVMDLARTRDLDAMYHCKTGALFQAAVRSGAVAAAAGPEKLTALTKYATALGLCFQIIDDLLDVVGCEEETGKSAGSDARLGKVTYVTLYGAQRAKELAQIQADAAVAALKPLGETGRHLIALALYLVNRIN